VRDLTHTANSVVFTAMLSQRWLIAVAVVAVLFKPVIFPALSFLGKAPFDPDVGTIPILAPAQLTHIYSNKRVLIVGGTRGVGRGVARVLAAAGAHVTTVSRSGANGAKVVKLLREVAGAGDQQFDFLRGDIGTAAGANALVETLAIHALQHGRWDYLVVTAAVFPDWLEPLQSDGLEKGFAIAVLGRYIIYSNMGRFLSEQARVLNVLASGQKLPLEWDRRLVNGERNASNLIEGILHWAAANEVMQVALQSRGMVGSTTRVSTHPGILQTELHRGQGWLMDLAEPIAVAVVGFSEEQAGQRQASILASEQLHTGALSYVDQDMHGRLAGANLLAVVAEHSEWLWALLQTEARRVVPVPPA
jgi:hypothetical protein